MAVNNSSATPTAVGAGTIVSPTVSPSQPGARQRADTQELRLRLF